MKLLPALARVAVSITVIMTGVSAVRAASLVADSRVHDAVGRALDTPLLAMSADDDEFEFDKPVTVKDGQPEAPGKKSALKAALLSALVPGAGEYYVGNKGKARVFFAVDAATWLAFAWFRIYGQWKEDDFIRFAETRAGARLDGKSDEFLDWVGFYESIYEFNSLGRVGDPERPYLQDTDENHWLWQDGDDREVYRHMKNRSREAFRRSEFMLGLAAVTRVISVLDAIRDAGRANRRMDDSMTDLNKPRFQLSVNPLSTSSQVRLTLYTSF